MVRKLTGLPGATGRGEPRINTVQTFVQTGEPMLIFARSLHAIFLCKMMQFSANSARLLKQLVHSGCERDEPGDGPSSIGLATENVHALFRRRVLDTILLRREGPRHPDNRDITQHENLVNIRIVVVELNVGPGQHRGEVCAHRFSRALHYLRDRVDKIWREEVANPSGILGVEIGRPALEALHDSRLIGGNIGVGR
jgi:hypothetical protein